MGTDRRIAEDYYTNDYPDEELDSPSDIDLSSDEDDDYEDKIDDYDDDRDEYDQALTYASQRQHAQQRSPHPRRSDDDLSDTGRALSEGFSDPEDVGNEAASRWVPVGTTL